MPAAKFCVTSGCYEPASKRARSADHCGTHYASEVLAGVELVKFEVTAERTPKGRNPGVTDTRTRQTVYRGGVAELDPQETNIAALVAAGLGRVVVKAEPAKADKAKG